MSGKRKNAGAGYGYMFSGAFAKKADAVKKEKQRKGSFVKAVFVNGDMRYAVMTPRTNPIKRKKKAKKESKGEMMKRRLAELGAYTPRPAAPAQNPAELLVMGANPGSRELTVPAGSTITIRMNPTEARLANPDHYTSAQARAAGIYYRAPGLIQTTRQKRVAGMVRRARKQKPQIGLLRALRADVASALVNQGYKPTKAKRMAHAASGDDFSSLFHDALRQNPLCGAMIGGYPCTRKPGHRGPHLPQGATMRTRKRLPHKWQPNPSAAALRSKFTGKDADRVRIMEEPHMPAGDYAMLGKLLALYVKPRKGGQVLQIEARGVTVVSDESARQIYFVGGDQDVSAGFTGFGALDRGAGLYELGEARRIDYKQRKEHVPHPESDSWRHEFGEETGMRPTVLYDANAKRLLLEGGEYEIREEGIVN
jgi:hypothetical protein